MRRFAELYEALDATTSTNAKVASMVAYFREAAPGDAAWALYFLSGRRLKRLIAPRLLAVWAIEVTGTAPWLFDESLGVVGDLAETVALLLDSRLPAPRRNEGAGPRLAELIERRLLPLREGSEEEKRALVVALWESLEMRETFLLNKLVTGELRVGVSDTLAVRAVAQRAGLEPGVVSHRLMGSWTPGAAMFEALLLPGDAEAHVSRPYPFFLASPLQDPLAAPVAQLAPAPSPASPVLAALGERALWLAEWKWDGIRAQLVRRAGERWLWSRGEELITDRFPDLHPLMRALPDGTVHVFELHFEGIAASPRHKSGIAVRFPRIARWRLDKKPPEADTLETLRAMIRA